MVSTTQTNNIVRNIVNSNKYVDHKLTLFMCNKYPT